MSSPRTRVAGEKSHRIPSLDGLRAISIVLVFAHHVAGTVYSPIPKALTDHLALGELGVRFFFVISGFLITGLLLEELDKDRSISLGRFYFRRTTCSCWRWSSCRHWAGSNCYAAMCCTR